MLDDMMDRRSRNVITGEPCELKGSSTVLREAVGKGLVTIPRWRPTYNRSATRGRESSCEAERTSPGVLPPVPYQDMRLEQSDGMKPPSDNVASPEKVAIKP